MPVVSAPEPSVEEAAAAAEGGEEEDGLLFDLETRVKNLEAIEAAEPWRCVRGWCCALCCCMYQWCRHRLGVARLN